MTPEEKLMRLYEIRNELEEKATRRFQMDFGPLYTEELKDIDEQIEQLKKQYPFFNDSLFVYKKKTPEELKADKKREVEQKLNKAKYEYDSKQENKNDEIFKLSPEFYGVGINLVSLWKKIKSWF